MIHVKNFIDLVQHHKTKNSHQIVIQLKDAEKIAYDLSRLMADYIDLKEQNISNKTDNDINVEMDGGEW